MVAAKALFLARAHLPHDFVDDHALADFAWADEQNGTAIRRAQQAGEFIHLLLAPNGPLQVIRIHAVQRPADFAQLAFAIFLLFPAEDESAPGFLRLFREGRGIERDLDHRQARFAQQRM